nr:hypothetical protein [Neiella litorisoli]
MWREFCVALQHQQCHIDSNIHNPADTRRGITALAYITANSRAVSDEITALLEQLKRIEPSQYYYPANELHLTLLSIISCIDGFKLSDIEPAAYAAGFSDALAQCEPIDIEFRGVTASPACILIQGFPIGDGLAALREQLRRNFKSSALRSNIDSRYKLMTAHTTAVRFCTPLQNATRLLDCCEQFRNHHFGTARLSNFELVFNDWYQRWSVTQSLAKLTLG